MVRISACERDFEEEDSAPSKEGSCSGSGSLDEMCHARSTEMRSSITLGLRFCASVSYVLTNGGNVWGLAMGIIGDGGRSKS